MPTIHHSAVIDPQATLGEGVIIGPNCVVVGAVNLGQGVELLANVFLQGPLTIGPRTRIWPGASIGTDPQDYKVKPGFPTAGVTIGADCLLREGVTIHSATKADVPTRIGDRVFMMVNSHAGHDAHVSDDVVIVNGSMLAGHTFVGPKVNISGNSALHQFCRVGKGAMLSGGSAISTDVPPYCVTVGRNALAGLNLVGMRRSGVPREHITLTREAYRKVFRANAPRSEMIALLTEYAASGAQPVIDMLDFVTSGKKPICPYRPQPSRSGLQEDGDLA
jgi:UDP-N-acetylglucosamine acyltransferase